MTTPAKQSTTPVQPAPLPLDTTTHHFVLITDPEEKLNDSTDYYWEPSGWNPLRGYTGARRGALALVPFCRRVAGVRSTANPCTARQEYKCEKCGRMNDIGSGCWYCLNF